eukprot:RCo049261
MSLNQYTQVPPTLGRVKLQTSHGDVVVELWSKECPKACRNFVQLCMERYYDNCIFHRIVKDFLVQGGDPTGTGDGGESVYGQPFKRESHSRLKFTGRGLLAMAGTDNDNGSQFIITLGPCPWLDNKHTIFGRLAGSSIFNILPMGDLETDENDRPLFPPKITGTQVLDNPFEDIEPREKPAEVAEAKPKAEKGIRSNHLISFGEEVEEQEQEEIVADFKGVRSSHDVLNDPRLLKEEAYTKEELAEIQAKNAEAEAKKGKFLGKVKEAASAKGVGHDDDEGDSNSGSDFEEKMREKAKKRGRPEKDESLPEWMSKDDSELEPQQLSLKRRYEAATQFQQLKKEMLAFKKQKQIDEQSRLHKEDKEFSFLEARRLQYLKRKVAPGEKERRTLEKMKAFQAMLSVPAQRQERDRPMVKPKPGQHAQEEEEEEEEEVPVSSSDNPAHKLESL